MSHHQQILKLSEVKLITGLSASSIYRAVNKGTFPRQIKLGERSSGWLMSDVTNWLDERIEASRTSEVA
ncbi:MAG: AlpA family transcriptional regulator [Methylophaga sp.]|uniref:helix-turn-helix transcriptional regulator n=1 Tax=Methylophaga sp. TaxID=2024840 RepID=UPI00299CE312|nr:AlpA family transcriptional regulator [Methylophaga sp.]MDX1749036.1 AlpA family transcriptional regulator [Methylophaga sp.]